MTLHIALVQFDKQPENLYTSICFVAVSGYQNFIQYFVSVHVYSTPSYYNTKHDTNKHALLFMLLLITFWLGNYFVHYVLGSKFSTKWKMLVMVVTFC